MEHKENNQFKKIGRELKWMADAFEKKIFVSQLTAHQREERRLPLNQLNVSLDRSASHFLSTTEAVLRIIAENAMKSFFYLSWPAILIWNKIFTLFQSAGFIPDKHAPWVFATIIIIAAIVLAMKYLLKIPTI